MDIDQLYQTYLLSHSVTTDSRQITPGCIFFAFKGENFDGNAFVPQALNQGAALCVTTHSQYSSDPRCMVVPDVLSTIQQLASRYRQDMQCPVFAITGTNGKTTTKELVAAVLGRRYRVHATSGNFNNHIGLPLTILSTPPDTQILIVEMGANHPSEIEALCHIANPTAGLITNVGHAHLEGFGGFEGVVQTKTELYRHLAANRKLAFVDADSQRLMYEAERLSSIPDTPSNVPSYIPGVPLITPEAISSTMLSLITYGSSEGADIRGTLVGSNPYMRFYFEVGDNVYTVQSNLLGNYNFSNAMAATAVGLHFGVDPWDIKQAIEEYRPTNRRSQFKQTLRNTLYLDCYNANPTSMAAALDNFESILASGKVAMLGGMKELGSQSRYEHEVIADRLAKHDDIKTVLVGPEFQFVTQSRFHKNILWFPDSETARQHFADNPLSNCTILLKGSNSTRMWLLEEVL